MPTPRLWLSLQVRSPAHVFRTAHIHPDRAVGAIGTALYNFTLLHFVSKILLRLRLSYLSYFLLCTRIFRMP